MGSNERTEFIGFHVTPAVKAQLKQRAEKYRLHLSPMLSAICEEWLGELNRRDLEKERREAKFKEKDTPLPFEEK